MDGVIRLGVADAGEVLTVQRAAYVTEAQAHGDLALPALVQPLPDLVDELAAPAVLGLGCRTTAGRLVAAVRARVTSTPTASWAEIGRLVVVPDRQGQGLGTSLLTALEDHLPSDVAELRLFTGEYSTANLRLYRRLGYVETGRRPTPAGYHLVDLAKPRQPST